VGRVAQHLEHVKGAIAAQQGFARSCSVWERIRIAALVDDALRFDADALGRQGVAVERDFADVPPLVTDRHKVLQILVNLISNAREAVTRVRAANPRIVVRLSSGNDGFVQIQVSDNGVGIAKEDLTRVFTHGFTTCDDGHGFGLHCSALSAKKLGGALGVHSDGPGRGAEFTLRLPGSIGDRGKVTSVSDS
jgi:C4-dicarboxylate-specific signal transduction histidine kinase